MNEKLQKLLNQFSKTDQDLAEGFNVFDQEINTLREKLKKSTPKAINAEILAELNNIRQDLDFNPLLQSLETLKSDFANKISTLTTGLSNKLDKANPLSAQINSTNQRISDNAETFDNRLEKLTKEFNDGIAVRKMELDKLSVTITALFNNAEKNLNEATDTLDKKIINVENIVKLNKDEADKLAEGFRKSLIDVRSRGGSMNRQIRVAGIDVLTRYTDINLIGSITAINNDTTKRVDLTFAGGGGAVTSVSDDGNLTMLVGPNIGDVLIGVNQASPFTWTADHTFKNNINFFPADSSASSFNMLYGDVNGVSQLKFYDSTNKYMGFQSGSGNTSIIWTLPVKDVNGFWYSDGSTNLDIRGISVDGVTITGNGTVGNPLVAVGGGSGTVTSVASADGSITVANPTTTVDLAVVKAPILTTSRTIGGVLFNGSSNIVPQTIQSVNEATDTTCFPLFISASGSQSLQPLNNAGFIYNSNINALTVTTFIGALTGNASTATNVAVGGITGLGTGIASWLATPSSANLASAITDETGSGALVFAVSPTLTTASLGSSTATTQTPADNSTKVATTAYVDNAILGQRQKEAVKYASIAALPSIVYANGSSGVGATLTGVALAALSLDSSSPGVGDRVLIKNQVSTFQNGIYTVTQTGSGIAVFILTRTIDFDQASDIQTGDSVFVTAGSTLATTTWTYNGIDNPVMGTDAITFVQAAGPGSYTPGNGISITGVSIAIDTSVTVDKTTVQTLTNKTLTSPTFTAPILGTPASGVGTNITGIPAANILAGSFGAGAYVISTSLQVATLELGAATDTTIARVSAGVISVEGSTVALASNNLSFFSATTSAQLRGVLSDENGTGVALFDSSTSATFITPILGTPTSGTLSNCTTATQTAGDNSTKLASTAYADALTRRYCISGATAGTGTSTPADATTYFFGSRVEPLVTRTASGVPKIFIPVTGTITLVRVVFSSNNSSNETSTLSLRLNNTTDTTVSSAIDLSSAITCFSVAGTVSIAVVAGDYVEFKWVTPTWATNPVACSCFWEIMVTPT